MASLHFVSSVMNAGKSTNLLQAAHNYESRGQKVVIMKPAMDTRDEGIVKSRIGLKRECILIEKDALVTEVLCDIYDDLSSIACILIDEAQFLSRKQVWDLAYIVDELNIPVMCYGIVSDFKTKLFEGSKTLLEIADKKVELKSVCDCGKKALFNARLINGKRVVDGPSILVGAEETYRSYCRKCFVKLPVFSVDNDS